MLKKAKKSRRSQQSKGHQNNSQHNNSHPNEDSSPSTSLNQTPHLGVSSQFSQHPSIEDNDEMDDAFL